MQPQSTMAAMGHALAAFLFLQTMPMPSDAANQAQRPKSVMVFPAGDTGLSYVFSHPAYLASSVEETPYQLLEVCDRAKACRKVFDLRGEPSGVTVSPDTGFSPDRLYVIVMRLMQVDKRRKQYGRQTNEHVGVREGAAVRFVTPKGHEAGIGGWSAAHPHALEVWHDLESGHELAWPEHEVPPAP